MKTHQYKLQRTAANWGILAVAALSLSFGTENASARALGIDVSRWQGTINWTSVKGAGITFAWSQASRGMTSPNANFTANMSNGKSAGVYMGAYHYAYPGTNGPIAEADYFWNLAGPYIKADGKSMMPMLDMELWTGIVGATSYTDWANQWCNRVISKAAAAGVTVKPIIYTSACSYSHFNSGLSQWGAWVANYNGQDPQTGTPWSVCSSYNVWGNGYWNFWQYTDSGSVSGISGAVDRDVFNGTVSTLAANWLCTAGGGGGTKTAVIKDNPAASYVGTWSTGSASTDKYGADYRYHTTAAVSEPATFTASLNISATWNVRAWWPQGGNRSATTPYVVYHDAGSTTVSKNQQINGGAWQLLGSWAMSGTKDVKITCWTTTGFIVMADAVKWD